MTYCLRTSKEDLRSTARYQIKPSNTSNNNYYDEVTVDGVDYTILKTYTSLLIYVLLVLTDITIIFGEAYLFYKRAIRSSKNLHKKMFRSILLAPVQFFNTNPCGRILNRFSKDIGAVDEYLPALMFDVTKVSNLFSGASFWL